MVAVPEYTGHSPVKKQPRQYSIHPTVRIAHLIMRAGRSAGHSSAATHFPPAQSSSAPQHKTPASFHAAMNRTTSASRCAGRSPAKENTPVGTLSVLRRKIAHLIIQTRRKGGLHPCRNAKHPHLIAQTRYRSPASPECAGRSVKNKHPGEMLHPCRNAKLPCLIVYSRCKTPTPPGCAGRSVKKTNTSARHLISAATHPSPITIWNTKHPPRLCPLAA